MQVFLQYLPAPGSPQAIALVHSIAPIVLLGIPFWCLYRVLYRLLNK